MNTPWSRHPNDVERPVGVFRVRPLQRGSVPALLEAPAVRRERTRGGTAYPRPLSIWDRGRFFVGGEPFVPYYPSGIADEWPQKKTTNPLKAAQPRIRQMRESKENEK